MGEIGSLEFKFQDFFEIEIEIFNSKSRLMTWASNEKELQNDPKIKAAVRQNYKKLSINL